MQRLSVIICVSSENVGKIWKFSASLWQVGVEITADHPQELGRKVREYLRTEKRSASFDWDPPNCGEYNCETDTTTWLRPLLLAEQSEFRLGFHPQ